MSELKIYIDESSEKFKSLFRYVPEFIAAAPGRINIIGEHTDYNGGLSMPGGINRWVVVSGSLRNDKHFVIKSRDFNDELAFDFTSSFKPEKSWHKYIYGALSIFFENQSFVNGADIFIMGNIPVGSGVSSSAGLLTAFFNFLSAVYRKEDDNTLVKYCQLTEHRFLGVKSGILDQSASQFSKKGKLMVLDFQGPSHYYIDADFKDWIWVLADTKVKRELAGSKYSERVNETKEALEILKKKNKAISHFRDINLSDVEEIPDRILRNRIKHFIEENHRVEEVEKVLKANDFTSLGNLLNKSHASLRDLYEVSCKELDYLADLASKLDGCAGSRMMGGGFGGCTISLVKKDKLESFKSHIQEGYKKDMNLETELNVYEIVDGAFGSSVAKL